MKTPPRLCKPCLQLPILLLSLLAAACSAGAVPAMFPLADTRQQTQIETTYALNPYLRYMSLDVQVRDGHATLSGTVEDAVSRDLAQEIARGVSGIRKIDNRIKIQADYQPRVRAEGEPDFARAVDDATITAAIRSKLLWSRHASALNGEVITRDGQVILRGTADTDAARQQAQQLARHTRGVGSVDNQITLRLSPVGAAGEALPAEADKESLKRASETAGQTLADSWVTAKVMSTLLYSSNVTGSQITVATQDGVVALTGTLPSGAERALAISLAENVRGVKRVQATGLTI